VDEHLTSGGADGDERLVGQHLSPGRRTIALSIARTTANVAVVLVVYSLLPLDRPFGWGTVGALVGGLGLIGLLVAWQVRSVLRSPHPGLRALEMLAVTVPLFLALFAAVYVVLESGQPGSFSEPLTRTDAFYFVITVFATVGFGDISAVSETARLLTSLQMVGDLLVIGLVVRAMLAAAQRGSRERAAGRDRREDGGPG
jgi:hypothetical protein